MKVTKGGGFFYFNWDSRVGSDTNSFFNYTHHLIMSKNHLLRTAWALTRTDIVWCDRFGFGKSRIYTNFIFLNLIDASMTQTRWFTISLLDLFWFFGWEPWSGGKGRILILMRSWVRILPDTRWMRLKWYKIMYKSD